jgi:hypothetical protein
MQHSTGRFSFALIARRHRLAVAGLVALCASSVALVSIATAENPARYPYDPACAWGRLADGHGMLLRCLEPSEASALLEADAQGPSAPVAPKPNPAAAPATSAAPASAASSATPVASAAPAPSASTDTAQKVSVSAVGPTVADSGALPLADKKLGAAKDRYIECATKNGGLTAPKAKVVLRFLVRERGRAEGVEIKSFTGVSRAVADCIADVVDRRYVGYPEDAIVGATFPIELSLVR